MIDYKKKIIEFFVFLRFLKKNIFYKSELQELQNLQFLQNKVIQQLDQIDNIIVTIA